jgi:hypothetical protein
VQLIIQWFSNALPPFRAQCRQPRVNIVVRRCLL